MTISYKGVHQRLFRSFGSASNYSCVDCGNEADEWSYTHDDTTELFDEKIGLYYSLYPEFYAPRCFTCHRTLDVGNDTDRKEYQKNWAKNNPDRVKAKQQKYRSSEKGKAKDRERARRYRAANIEMIRAKDRARPQRRKKKVN